MNRRAVRAGELEAYYLPAPLRRDMHLEYGRGDQPAGLSRLELERQPVRLCDAGSLFALMADLYPNGEDQ